MITYDNVAIERIRTLEAENTSLRNRLAAIRDQLTHGLYHLGQSNLDDEGDYSVRNFQSALAAAKET